MKKAYKCVYCNYIIHIKCYDKTIGKTICERFYAKNGLKKDPTPTDTNNIPKITVESEDPFSMLPLERADQHSQLRKSNTNVELSMGSEHDLEGTSLPATPRNATTMVSNFFSGIRQRKWAPNEEQSATKSGFLSSFNLSLSSSISRSKSVIYYCLFEPFISQLILSLYRIRVYQILMLHSTRTISTWST